MADPRAVLRRQAWKTRRMLRLPTFMRWADDWLKHWRGRQRSNARSRIAHVIPWHIVAPGHDIGLLGAPSDCMSISCRREWAGGAKCDAGTCAVAYGVSASESKE